MREASRNARLDHASKKRDRILKRYGLEGASATRPNPRNGRGPVGHGERPGARQRARRRGVGEVRRVSRGLRVAAARRFGGLHLLGSRRRTSGARTASSSSRARRPRRKRPRGRGRRPRYVLPWVRCIVFMRTAIGARRGPNGRWRSPRAEDGAALRNSRVLCNSDPTGAAGPRRRTTGRRRRALCRRRRRHFGRVAQLGVAAAPASQLAAAASTSSYASPSSRALRSSRFQLAAHDARLLLLRLAHNEPLHQESGGGSRRSNLEPASTYCKWRPPAPGPGRRRRAADAALAQRERRHLDAVVAASPDRAQGSADQRKRAAEAAPHAALPAPFSASSDRWSVQRKHAGLRPRAQAVRGPREEPGRGLGRRAEPAAAPARRASPRRRTARSALPIRRRRRPAPADVEAATAARAVTYARATLAYVALVDKLQSMLATPLRAGRDRHQSAGRPHVIILRRRRGHRPVRRGARELLRLAAPRRRGAPGRPARHGPGRGRPRY